MIRVPQERAAPQITVTHITSLLSPFGDTHPPTQEG